MLLVKRFRVGIAAFGQEVIMTSKRKVYGSQDFFALDIPVT